MEYIPPEGERGPERRRSRVGLAFSVALSILLVVLLVANNDDVKVDILFTDFTAPLWLFLGLAALCGSFIGYFFGRRNMKRKWKRDRGE